MQRGQRTATTRSACITATATERSRPEAATTSRHTGSEPQSFLARDFNGDGHSDLAFVDYLDDTLTILLWNDGTACR